MYVCMYVGRNTVTHYTSYTVVRSTKNGLVPRSIKTDLQPHIVYYITCPFGDLYSRKNMLRLLILIIRKLYCRLDVPAFWF